MNDDGGLDAIVDLARERIYAAKQRLRPVLGCERCCQPIHYGALCPRCDPDEWGLYEENRDRWTT